MRRTWTYGLALAAVALGMAWLYGEIDYASAFAHVDLRHYRAMAQAAPGFADVPQPFVFRPLGPYLVGLLPLPDPLGFYLLTLVALVGLCLLLYGLLMDLGLAPPAAAFTVALLTLNPYVFGFFAFNFFQLADVLAFALIVAAFWALYHQRWLALAGLLAAGAVTREPVMLVIPAAFVYLLETRHLRSEGVALSLAVLPALALFVGLRLAVEPTGGPGLLQTFLNASGKAASPTTWYRLLVNAWAPLSLLPLVFLRETRVWVRAHLHLVAFATLVLFSSFFGGDQERLIAPAFVAVYALVGYLLQEQMWTRHARIVLVVAAILTSLHHLTARFPLPSRTWTIVLSLLALAAATGVGVWVRSQCSERTPLSPAAR